MHIVNPNHSIRAHANVVARSICAVLHNSLLISQELFLAGSYIAKLVLDPSEYLGRFLVHEIWTSDEHDPNIAIGLTLGSIKRFCT